MKHVCKRAAAAVLALCLLLALAACGAKEQTVTLRSPEGMYDFPMTETMTFTAKGDRITRMVNSLEVDTSSLDDEAKEMLSSVFADLGAQYTAVEGVTAQQTEDPLRLEITLEDVDQSASALAEKGLLEIEGTSKGISLEKTIAALKENGYELVEE